MSFVSFDRPDKTDDNYHREIGYHGRSKTDVKVQRVDRDQRKPGTCNGHLALEKQV